MRRNIKTKFNFAFAAFFILAGCFFSLNVYSAILGETKIFFVDPLYENAGKKEVSASLVKISNKLYFYVDNSLWNTMSAGEKTEAENNLSLLTDEFEKKIYPTLTSNFGQEWNPGIDNDPRITVLLHPMRKGSGGYFNNGNEYEKLQVPESNEREMVYINSDYISSPFLKTLLAHEFTHLITFNQKERIYGKQEEVWLNEGRAEYALTLCGYDSEYQGSNLQKRVIEFLKNPNDSITEWNGFSSDYGGLNLFIQYLVDHYGVKILNDSLHTDKKGIESLNYVLTKNGYKENFSQIFTDWTIAVFLNDCSFGGKYCYKNSNLKNLKVLPVNNFLPMDSPFFLTKNYFVGNWAANWDRISGGSGDLYFRFDGETMGEFKVSYVLCDNSGSCQVNFLNLDNVGDGEFTIKNFSKNYSSFTIMPSAQSDSPGTFYFSWRIESGGGNGGEGNIEILLKRIEDLKKQVAELQAELAALEGIGAEVCGSWSGDLYFGLMADPQVRCLQEFLKNQGVQIYPEGLVTGNFLTLTKSAVTRFQEKYFGEILKPLGLTRGTGYVGDLTKAKINKLLGY